MIQTSSEVEIVGKLEDPNGPRYILAGINSGFEYT